MDKRSVCICTVFTPFIIGSWWWTEVWSFSLVLCYFLNIYKFHLEQSVKQAIDSLKSTESFCLFRVQLSVLTDIKYMVKHLYVVEDRYTVHFWHLQRPKRTKQKTAFLLKVPESLDFDSEYYVYVLVLFALFGCLCQHFIVKHNILPLFSALFNL